MLDMFQAAEEELGYVPVIEADEDVAALFACADDAPVAHAAKLM